MKQICFAALMFFVSEAAFAQTEYFQSGGTAINGYDPVSYFTDNLPVKGVREFSYSWSGTEWWFANASNLNTFKADPEKYAPQFGGYCAYGASQNHKSPTDPAAFTIVNNKLYLNYSPKVKELWSRDIPGHITRAESNWVELKNKK